MDSTHNESSAEESYFASFTDLLVGILFIFIIMLAHASIQKMQSVDKMTKVDEYRAVILENIRRSLEEQGVFVQIDTRNGVFRLPERILFDSGKYELSQGEAENAINALAKSLLTYLPCISNIDESIAVTTSCPAIIQGPYLDALLIEGHTDRRPINVQGVKDGNNWLSAMRAITVFERLKKSDSRLEGIKNKNGQPVIGVSGYGSQRPIPDENIELSRNLDQDKKQRRIEIRLIMSAPPEDIKSITEAIPSP